MSRQHRKPVIFVVSNRLPVTVRRTDNTYDVSPSSGGLVGALQGFAGSTEFRWYGWPGLEIPEQHRATVEEQLATQKAYPVFFDKALADKHYNGFSNKILWPLLHYQTHQIHMSKEDWEAYQEVNRAFAESIASEVEDGDIVWIQDYHLLLMPRYLRQAFSDGKNIRIGFFLHTVFPSSDFFRILPVRKDLLESLLHCDVVGFHNQDYTHHFLDCCTKILHLETCGSQIVAQDRKVTLLTNPVGIDPCEFRGLLDRSDVKERVQNLEGKYKGVQLIISVDRLDYIKGILLRLEAMDAFLSKYPDYASKVVLLQIVIPSREDVEDYRELHDQINQTVSQVNGKHGPVDVTPIHSLFSPVGKAELTALYAVSDVCIVSSIRDGFNVVSLEYVVCQRERHGVLLLSEFAGASAVLDKSVSINPWDTDEFADAIHSALSMEREERTARWESLNQRVEQFTSKRWGEAFLESLKHFRHGLTAGDGVANSAVDCASGTLE